MFEIEFQRNWENKTEFDSDLIDKFFGKWECFTYHTSFLVKTFAGILHSISKCRPTRVWKIWSSPLTSSKISSPSLVKILEFNFLKLRLWEVKALANRAFWKISLESKFLIQDFSLLRFCQFWIFDRSNSFLS